MSTVKSSSEDLTLNADGAGNDVVIQSNGATTATVTAEGLLNFNSGYGSAAAAYGCRAWIALDCSGSPFTILSSGNVSSVIDGGTGNIQINFSTALPDTNHAIVASSNGDGNGFTGGNRGHTMVRVRATTAAYINTTLPDANTLADYSYVSVAIFR